MNRNSVHVMSRLIKLVKPLSFYMILAILLGTLGHLAASFITITGGIFIFESISNGSFPFQKLAVLLFAFAFFRGVLRYGEQAFNHYIAFKLLALIRDRVFTSLRFLSPSKLEGKNKGNLISLITSDIELLEVFYAHTISPICIAIIFGLVMLSFISSYSFLLAIIAFFAYLTVGLILPLIFSRLSKEDAHIFRNESGRLSSFVLDSLRGLFETIQYDDGKKRLLKMNEKTKTLLLKEEKMKTAAGLSSAFTLALILSFNLLMLSVSSYLFDFRTALITTIALMSSFGPFISLSNLGTGLQNTIAAGNRVLDILDEKPVVEEIVGEGEIDFENANTENIIFSYKTEPVLNNFSLQIPKNRIIGISGPSGCGKSSLLKLFMRFWDVNGGNVKITGRNVKNINTDNLRRLESFVTQETHLFNDTVKNNLLIANLAASDDEVILAAKKASIHDFIMSLPDGYDTNVGELGGKLSGGERQRIGLARSFLHDAPFMLLDEPTSNLDSLNEAIILKSLDEARSDKTVILVSHRKSSLKMADIVYQMKDGAIVGG